MTETMMPLTNNRGRLNTIVQNMTNPPAWRQTTGGSHGTAYGGTRIFEGAAWALRALHPDWSGIWPVGSRPSAANDASKYIMIMSDGNQLYTEPYSRARADSILLDVCEEAAEIGAVVYTIAFRAPTAAQTLLRGCATSDAHYIRADNETALQQAFQQIAREIGNPVPRLIY